MCTKILLHKQTLAALEVLILANNVLPRKRCVLKRLISTDALETESPGAVASSSRLHHTPYTL